MYILGKDGKEYILETNSLDEGFIRPEEKGAEVDRAETDRDIIVMDGYYYYLNWRKHIFCKSRKEESAFKTLASLPFDDFSLENFCWLGKDTLFLAGLDSRKFSEPKYFIVNTADMRVLKEGILPVPGPSGGYNSMSIGFLTKRPAKLIIGYTYHKQLSTATYTTSDTIYTVSLKFPEISALTTAKDIRSAYPGGMNTVQSYSFTDEQGNFYFMSCPGIALGNRPDRSTGIFRINADEDGPDKNYFFNISASGINNHAYGLWYLGNNKAIIRSERKDLFKDLNDHYSVPHFEFYLLDLLRQSVLKLDLPLDKGTRRECVIVENGKAYIAVNSTKEGNFIWILDIKTGMLTKGLEVSGDTDYILRIDRLHN